MDRGGKKGVPFLLIFILSTMETLGEKNARLGRDFSTPLNIFRFMHVPIKYLK